MFLIILVWTMCIMPCPISKRTASHRIDRIPIKLTLLYHNQLLMKDKDCLHEYGGVAMTIANKSCWVLFNKNIAQLHNANVLAMRANQIPKLHSLIAFFYMSVICLLLLKLSRHSIISSNRIHIHKQIHFNLVIV